MLAPYIAGVHPCCTVEARSLHHIQANVQIVPTALASIKAVWSITLCVTHVSCCLPALASTSLSTKVSSRNVLL
jgi:hypothetical protein